MTRDICDALARHADVEQFIICGPPTPDVPHATSVPLSQIDAVLEDSALVWFEPARHYWWKPGLLRRMCGASFPIVSMMHSIGYSYQVSPLIASLSTPRLDTDIVIAPSHIAKRVFLNQCAYLIDTLELKTEPPIVEVIPYGVRSVTITPQLEARHILGWNDDPVILFLGRIDTRDKADFDALLEACARLTASHHVFHLVLAGAATEGSQESLCRRIASFGLTSEDRNMAEVRSNVSEIEKMILLSGCDVFVSPSNTISESFGLSIVEAMLHSRPVVCTAWSAYREIVRNGIDGYLVDIRWNAANDHLLDLSFAVESPVSVSTNVAVDIDQMTECLHRLLISPDLRKKFGESGRTRAESQFLIGHTAEKVVDIMKRLRGECPSERVTRSSSLHLASAFADYASATWQQDGMLEVVEPAHLQRMMRVHMPDISDSERSLVQRRFATGAVSGKEAAAFGLLRRGLLRQTGIPRDDLHPSRSR